MSSSSATSQLTSLYLSFDSWKSQIEKCEKRTTPKLNVVESVKKTREIFITMMNETDFASFRPILKHASETLEEYLDLMNRISAESNTIGVWDNIYYSVIETVIVHLKNDVPTTVVKEETEKEATPNRLDCVGIVRIELELDLFHEKFNEINEIIKKEYEAGSFRLISRFLDEAEELERLPYLTPEFRLIMRQITDAIRRNLYREIAELRRANLYVDFRDFDNVMHEIEKGIIAFKNRVLFFKKNNIELQYR